MIVARTQQASRVYSSGGGSGSGSGSCKSTCSSSSRRSTGSSIGSCSAAVRASASATGAAAVTLIAITTAPAITTNVSGKQKTCATRDRDDYKAAGDHDDCDDAELNTDYHKRRLAPKP